MAMGMALVLPLAGQAGQSEWATAGKVLTGVVAAGVIAEALRPQPAPQPVVVYQQPMAPVVYSAPVAPPPGSTVVYSYAPAPQVVYAPAPPPVVVVAPPVYVGPGYYGPRPYAWGYHAPLCRPVYGHGGRVGVTVHFGGR